MRDTPRYLPRARIYRVPDPDTRGMLNSVLSNEFLSQTSVAPGQRSNIDWLVLRPEDDISDAGLPGNEPVGSKYRPPAVILNHDIRWKDTRPKIDWAYQPSPEEQDWRNLALATYEGELEELEAIENPSEEEMDRLISLRGLVSELSEGGEGYLEGSPYMMNTGAAGITWGLAAANVPVTITSLFLSQKNRALSFRLMRLEAPEGQANHTFTIEFGGGKALYAIEIGEDGNASKFIHYKQMSETARQALLEAAKEIQDRGRLTVVDLNNIKLWENQIGRIELYNKQRKAQALEPEYEDLLVRLQQDIDDLKDSKRGLSDLDQEALDAIEEELYEARDDFLLHESNHSLIGQSVDITIHFLRAGYVVIQTREGRKSFEIKRITGGDPEGSEPTYGNCIPEGTAVTLKSNGGIWSLVYGHPRYDWKGTLWTQPFDVPFSFDEADVQWLMEGDCSNPGCDISYSLEQVGLIENVEGYPYPGRYRIKVELRSNNTPLPEDKGMYTPELYYLEFMIPVPKTDDDASYLWHSEMPQFRWPDGSSRIVDLTIQDDDGRSRMCRLMIANGNGNGNLPGLLGGAACDIDVWDRLEEVAVPVIKCGFIGTQGSSEHDVISQYGEYLLKHPAGGNITPLEVTGCENFLDKEVTLRVVGNGRYIGDYLRILAQNAGLPSSLYAGLPVEDEGNCPKLPRVRPGSFPDIKPTYGVKVWEWMKEVVDKHAPTWDLWTEGTGIRLTPKLERRRTDIAYSSLLAYDDPKALRKTCTVQGGLRPEQDIREYWTKATFVGAIDPKTKMRFAATVSIPQATDPRFATSMFYVGTEKHYQASYDDTLRSVTACRKAARQFLNITPLTPNGFAPWSLTWMVDLDTTVRVGDLVTVNGLEFYVKTIEFAALNSKSQDGQKMILKGLLVEDRELYGG